MTNIEEKIPLKVAELSIKKFNEDAVPHYLGLLKNHKSNIEKNLALGDWTKVKKEEINATRVMKQLKNVVLEMDMLRSKVQNCDIEKFDKLISTGREDAYEGIKEYIDLQLKSPSSTKSEKSCYDLHEDIVETVPQIQSDFQLQEHQILARQACLEEFETLQREVEDLHGMFRKVHEIAHEQGESVEIIAENAAEALENVNVGAYNLRAALQYKKAIYPFAGAVVGSCIGGPIGLIVGIKAGGLAAVSCGVLGFMGGSVLKKNETIDEGIAVKKDE